jgi:hypothetical protein
MAWAADVQAELGGRAFAGDAGPGRVGGGQPRAFGVAGGCAAIHIRQVRRQPALALGQRLGMGIDGFDAVQGFRKPQQVVAHHEADFADDVQGRVQEQVERARHHAFGGVLHRHDAVAGAAGRRGAKHLVDADAGHVLDAGAEKLQRRLLAEGAGGAQVGDAHRGFEGQAGRHDFAPDGGDVLVLERALVGLLDLFDHLGHPVGAEEGRAFTFLDLAHLLGDLGTAVQQGKQFPVQGVDLDA